MGRRSDLFRAGAVALVWVVHVIGAKVVGGSDWQASLPLWHFYLLVSWGLLITAIRVDFVARRTVWLVPLLDMPMLFWIESIHAPMSDPPAEVVGYTAAGFVILVVWTALALDARFTMLGAALAGLLQAELSRQNGGNVLAVIMSITLMLVAGAMTVLTTRLLAAATRDVVEARVKRQEALRVSQDKDRFISTVSHDFRTPLAVLLTALQSVEGDPDLDPEMRGDFLRRAIRQCRKMMSMTEELLHLAQLGARRPERTSVDLAALARETVRGLEPQAERKGVLLVGPPATSEAYAEVDEALIERALSNLVDNALRYGGERVVVSAVARSEMVQLTVADDGAGIKEGELDRIFEPFHRATRSGDGSGLGLAIVKEVARVHEGRAAVSSAPGEGTVFELWIPRRTPSGESTSFEKGERTGWLRS